MVVLFVVLTFILMLLADWVIKRKEYRKLMTPDKKVKDKIKESKNTAP